MKARKATVHVLVLAWGLAILAMSAFALVSEWR